MLVWIVAYIAKAKTTCEKLKRRMDNVYTKKMRPESWSAEAFAQDKDLLVDSLTASIPRITATSSGVLTPIAPLLHNLARLAEKYDELSGSKAKELKIFDQKEVEDAFQEYLDVFKQHMPMETTWDYITTLAGGE